MKADDHPRWRFKSTRIPPGMFRAFAAFTNIDAFYQAFDVKPGDKALSAAGRAREDW
jgi:predicted metalloendopeptidase